ncbi:HK97 gp10 family phage protein [Lysinibacillus sp. fkY74-1]
MASIDDLSSLISRELRAFSNHVEEEVRKAARDEAKKGVEKLKATSPTRGGSNSYATGWKTKKKGDNYIIYNEKKPQLTHLLENGHVNRDGSRTSAIVHIKPVEQEVIEGFLSALERGI